MKTRSLVVLVIGILLMVSLTAEENYSQLEEKVDSLETKLEEVYDSQIRNNPYANGETLDWGKGFFGSMKTGTDYTMNLELGYMFKLKKKPLEFLSSRYVDNRQSYRIGFSAGVQWFENEIVHNNKSGFYKSSGCGVYGKLNFGSPILLNFISFSWHLKAMYADPEEDSDHGIKDARMVYGFGNDLEFWLTKNSCVTVGFTDETDNLFCDDDKESIYPHKIRFAFGFKSFF